MGLKSVYNLRTVPKLMPTAIGKLKIAIENSKAILVGAGSGFSTAAGYTYSGERFRRHFADFIEKYHLRDMYTTLQLF